MKLTLSRKYSRGNISAEYLNDATKYTGLKRIATSAG